MTSPEQRAAARAAERLADLMTRMASRGLGGGGGGRIPVLEADPDSDDPTNLWLLEEGRLRARGADGTIFEFVSVEQLRPAIPTFTSDPAPSTGYRLWFVAGTGALRGRLANGNVVTYSPDSADTSTEGGAPAVGGGTSSKPKPADPKPKRYRKTYSAEWARAFCSKHGVETGSELNYGDFGGGYHGERRLMFGFDDAQIRSDLSGATLKRFQIRARNTHSHKFGGVRLHWGGHDQNNAPGSYSAVRRGVWSGLWPRSGYGAEWRTAHLWFGKAFKADVIRGLTIDQNGGRTEYGALDWDSVRIAIEYVK